MFDERATIIYYINIEHLYFESTIVTYSPYSKYYLCEMKSASYEDKN